MSQEDQDQRRVSTMIMIGIVVVFLLAMCSGCATVVPVTPRFPDAPGKSAMTACADLKKLQPGAQLSDVGRTVTLNYSTYYECAVKADAWQEWYQIQRRIFEGAAK